MEIKTKQSKRNPRAVYNKAYNDARYTKSIKVGGKAIRPRTLHLSEIIGLINCTKYIPLEHAFTATFPIASEPNYVLKVSITIEEV